MNSLALHKALIFLEDTVSACKSEGKAKLPSTRALAAEANVSIQTMWKAVRILKEKKVLSCFPGQGIFLAHLLERPEKSPVSAKKYAMPAGDISQYAWIRIADRIRQEIFSGIYPPGNMLPPYKELQRLYGCCFITLKKSLAKLHQEGCIQAYGKRYRVALPAPDISSARLILVYPRDFQPTEGFKPIGFPVERSSDVLLRRAEEACSRMQIRLQVLFGYTLEKHIEFFIMGTDKPYHIAKDSDVWGILYILGNLDIHVRELEFLASLRKSTAVVDTTGEFVASPALRKNPLVRIFRISSGKESGAVMARYLMERGHTSVAYFSPYHAQDWSRRRFAGLREALREANHSNTVQIFAIDWLGSRQSIVDSLTETQIGGTWRAAYNSWSASSPQQYSAMLNPVIDWLEYDGIARAELYRIMTPLFESALKNPAISVWVGANDTIAAMALDYLAHKNIRVPDDISVAGFDDSLEALKARLTSYNFGIESLMHEMVRHAVAQRHSLRASRKASSVIPGYIVERNTASARRLQ
jgi:DNA-binding transcriptional regulator YhcF (GntR family)